MANYKTLKACNTKSASDDVKAKKKACIKGERTSKIKIINLFQALVLAKLHRMNQLME